MAALLSATRIVSTQLSRQFYIQRFSKLAKNSVNNQTPIRCRCRFYSNGPTQQFTYETEEKLGPTAYFLLIVPLATFGLGTWQVQRRKWKLGLIKSLMEKTSKPPVDFPYDDLGELKNLEYNRVRLTGTFDHAHEIYITPRSLIHADGDAEGGGLISKAQSGSLVITPFKLSDREMTVLVNRGWVPRPKTLPHSRPEGQITKEVELVAVVRMPEKQAPFVPNNDERGVYYYWRDVDSMARKCNTEPVFLDADIDSTVPGGPIGGQTRVTLRNEHFSYIVTWYSLSAITSFLWWWKFIRKIAFL